MAVVQIGGARSAGTVAPMDRRLWLLLLPAALVLPACTEDDSPTIGDGSGEVTTTTAGGGTSTSTAAGGSTSTSSAPTTGSTIGGEGIEMSGPEGTSGNLRFTLAVDRSELCYRIAITGAVATESHVHRLTGENVLTLTAPGADGKVETCSATDQLLIEELKEAPERFYVDVHTDRGLIRGNLG
jgi:hypothetical protein